VGLPGQADVTLPSDTSIVAAYTEQTALLADGIIGARVKDLETRIAQAKDPQRLYNSLGLLYARFGLLAKAEVQFTRSAAIRSYAPALLNLGNVSLLRKDPGKAVRYYLQAFQQDPANPNVLTGLVQAYRALNNTADAERSLQQLARLSPDAAARLDAAGSEAATARAGDAAGKDMVTWEE
jgi:tetratricopeptide (TPR) repeat protein